MGNVTLGHKLKLHLTLTYNEEYIMEDFLWVEKYRPRRVVDTILPAKLKAAFQQFVDNKNISNLILSGVSGVGKTTVARAMLDEMGSDYIVIDASTNGNIDTLRNTIMNFASSMSFTGGRKYVILDEADEMLSSGFKEQVYNIFQHFNSNIQVALFSATLPEYINNITTKFMHDPVKIYVKAERLTLEGISQYFVAVEDDKQKYNTLKDLYSVISVSQCIIYCNSVKRVVDLYNAMLEDGFPVCCIHSSMDKAERDHSFADFKSGGSRVLISSNVTARGIDIQQVNVVINFDIPKDVHTYLHRIGRSGRWGRKGVGINFITRRDVSKIKEIEQYYSTQINEMPSNIDSLTK